MYKRQVFCLVNNYLDPQGIFIFDFNTEYKYREILGNQVIAEDRDECSFIWENYYNHTSMINEYELTLFVREDEEEALYRKYQDCLLYTSYSDADTEDPWRKGRIWRTSGTAQAYRRDVQRNQLAVSGTWCGSVAAAVSYTHLMSVCCADPYACAGV